MSDLTLDTAEVADVYPEWQALQRVARVMREEAGRLPVESTVAVLLEEAALRLLRSTRPRSGEETAGG
jgi:hypothetical protein